MSRAIPTLEVHAYDCMRRLVGIFDYDGKRWRAEVRGKSIPKVGVVDEANDKGNWKKCIELGEKPVYRVDCTSYCGENLEAIGNLVEHFLNDYDAAGRTDGKTPIVPTFYPVHSWR